jgi:serine/threonine-protein phosphatase 6 regulatory ankyrin repeat subunit A
MGHEALVRLLLEKGADPESKDASGQTPLRWAVEKGHVAVARLLVEKGADPESKDVSGQTPLRRAAEKGHVAVARLLVEKGARHDHAQKRDTAHGGVK